MRSLRIAEEVETTDCWKTRWRSRNGKEGLVKYMIAQIWELQALTDGRWTVAP